MSQNKAVKFAAASPEQGSRDFCFLVSFPVFELPAGRLQAQGQRAVLVPWSLLQLLLSGINPPDLLSPGALLWHFNSMAHLQEKSVRYKSSLLPLNSGNQRGHNRSGDTASCFGHVEPVWLFQKHKKPHLPTFIHLQKPRKASANPQLSVQSAGKIQQKSNYMS